MVRKLILLIIIILLFLFSCTTDQWNDQREISRVQYQALADKEIQVSANVWYVYDEETQIACYFTKYGGMHCFE